MEAQLRHRHVTTITFLVSHDSRDSIGNSGEKFPTPSSVSPNSSGQKIPRENFTWEINYEFGRISPMIYFLVT